MTSDGRTHSNTIFDRGGQAERTRLSWNRTGLALGVNAALLIQHSSTGFAAHVPALAMLALALACFAFAGLRYRQITEAVWHGRSVVVLAQLRGLALITVVPAVIALVGVLS